MLPRIFGAEAIAALDPPDWGAGKEAARRGEALDAVARAAV